MMSRAMAMALLLVVAAGCSEDDEELAVPLPSALFEAPDEVLISGEDLSTADGWAASNVVVAPAGATRIGMLIDLRLPSARELLEGRIQVRGFTQDGTPTAWLDASVTWSEEVYLVARADPGVTVYAAQLRLPEELAPDVAHIAFAAVTPGDGEAQATVEGALDTRQSALSVSGVVQSRSSWGARATKCTTKDATRTRMAIHHTYTPAKSGGSFEARLRSIQAYHMDTRGWCDVGYHYLVTEDGRVWEGRPVSLLGAHVGGHNTGNIGISFVGCFHSGECDSFGNPVPSQAALQGAADVVAALADQYDIAIDGDRIKGHTQHSGASTSCPGDNLLARLPDILALAQGEPGPADPLAPEPDETATGRVMGVVWDASVTTGPSDPGAKRIDSAAISAGGETKGVFEGSAYWELELPTGEWVLVATAPGYEPRAQTINVFPSTNTWASIGLTPIGEPAPPPSGPATVRVRDGTGAPLPDSVVHVDGAGYFLTDGGGSLVVALPADTAAVRAWAPGLQAATGIAQKGAVLDLALAPEATPPVAGTVQGVVWNAALTSSPSDEGAERVEGAIVVAHNGMARRARAGDAYWSFDVPPGTHSFTAVAAGYVPVTTTRQVASGDAIWASFGLLPPGATPVGETPDPDPEPQPTPAVCYPGSTWQWDVCFPLVPKSQLTEGGYTYPAGGPDAAQYAPPTHFLDLDAVDPGTMLAPNFALKEMMQASKGRFGVYSPQAMAHWQNVRSSLGVPLTVNSGYRSPGYNAGIDGSATFSRHMYGDAADVTASGAVSLNAIQNACYAEGADYVQVYTTHVHCDWRNDPLDPGFWAGLGAGKPGAHRDHPGLPASAHVDPPESSPAPGDAVLLRARYQGFDEGTPWVRWRVTGPGARSFVVEPSVHLAFEATTPGEYLVEWEVGGLLDGSLIVYVR